MSHGWIGLDQALVPAESYCVRSSILGNAKQEPFSLKH